MIEQLWVAFAPQVDDDDNKQVCQVTQAEKGSDMDGNGEGEPE